MRLERTEDVELIKSVIGHPLVRAALLEGDEEIKVALHPSIHYLIAREEFMADGAVEDRVIGLVGFNPVNSITWTPHVAVLPDHRGKGTQMLELGAKWMFESTACRKLFAAPPAFKVAMIRVFEKCGFQREGHSPRSFQWRGQVYGRVLMGKEKK